MSHATWVEPDTNSKRMYFNLQKTHESLKPSFRFNAIENPYIAWQTAAAPIGRRTICTSPAPGNYKASMRVAKLSIQSIANLHLLSLQLEQLEYLSTTPLSGIQGSHQVAVAKTDLTWTMIKLSARMWVKRHRTETEALSKNFSTVWGWKETLTPLDRHTRICCVFYLTPMHTTQ